MRPSIKTTFSDNEGNHLLVALDFYTDYYKQQTLHIPEEYCYIEIAEISITKFDVDKPIHPAVFFKMSTWLLSQFQDLHNVVFTYICSTDELTTNHAHHNSQTYRMNLFDSLLQRKCLPNTIKYQDVVIEMDGENETYGRAFYTDMQAPIIYIICDYLCGK